MHFSSTPARPWTQLSSVLDMDSTTIARRWRRLVSNGHSWVNAVAIGRTHIFGYLLIRTTQDSVADVGELLRQLSCAYLLARTEGEYEYFVGVVAADHKSLDALVCEHLAADPGILSIRSRVGVKVYRDGFSWEPGALGQAGRAQLATASTKGAAVPADPTEFRESDGALLEALGRDGRASYARLAAICWNERDCDSTALGPTDCVATVDFPLRCLATGRRFTVRSDLRRRCGRFHRRNSAILCRVGRRSDCW